MTPAQAHLLDFLAERAVPGIERVTGSRYARTLTGGGVVDVDLATSLRVRAVGIPAGAARAMAARLVGLDTEPDDVDALLAADPVLRPWVHRLPGIRVPGAADGFELAVRAILGQQVSVAGARTTAGRIVARFGDPVAAGPLTHAFPTAGRLAEASPADLGVPTQRAGAVRELARRIAGGVLDLGPAADPAQVRAGLLDIPGIGPWTVEYVAMRALRDPDAFPATDLGVRHGIAALGLDTAASAIRARAERWRPFRAYAVMHLWARLGIVE